MAQRDLLEYRARPRPPLLNTDEEELRWYTKPQMGPVVPPAPFNSNPKKRPQEFIKEGEDKKPPMTSQERAVMFQNILEKRLNPDERNKINDRQENADVLSGVGKGIEMLLKGLYAGGKGGKDTGHWDRSRQIFRQRQADREARKDKRLSNLQKLQQSAKAREDVDPTAPASRTLQAILKRKYPDQAQEIDGMSPQQVKDYGKFIFQKTAGRGATESDADRELKKAKALYYKSKGKGGGKSESDDDRLLKKAKAGYYDRKGGPDSAEVMAHKKNKYELLAVKLKAAQDANSPEGIVAIKKKIADLQKADLEEKPTRLAFKKADDFRKNYYNHPTTKRTDKMDTAYRKVQNSIQGTAASDMSLVFAYMKMLDSDSAVLPGEYATAQNTTGVPGWIRNKWNQMIDGTRLGDDQRQGFLDQSTKLWESQLGAQGAIDDRFRGFAEAKDINFDEIRGHWRGQIKKKPSEEDDEIGATKGRLNKMPKDGKDRYNKILNKSGGQKMHKVIPPGGSVPVMVPASDLDDALKNGGKLVE